MAGVASPISGTSAAAPLTAAIISQAYSGTRFGWLNPLIYQKSELFWDVTSGNNYWAKDKTCRNPSSGAGFHCAKGWDPVTGVGSFGNSTAKGAQGFLNELRQGTFAGIFDEL